MTDRSVMKPLMVSLDLEYNQPSRRIIQIGAVVGDIRSGEVVDRFVCPVNPGELLAPEIVKLCGIRQQDVDGAVAVDEAYRRLTDWMMPYEAQRSLNPLTWGGGDSEDLREALGLSVEDKAWRLGRRWVDVKTVFTAWRAAHNRPWDGGLARSMTKLGIHFEGRRHDALDDALNTFRVYVALLREFAERTDRVDR